MRMIGLTAMVALGLLALPAGAATLTSGTVSIEGVARVSCGASYKGDGEVPVTFELFNFGNPLLDTGESRDPEP